MVLDLDETLISTAYVNKIKYDLHKHKPHHFFENYIIFERPYLDEFMEFAFKNFNVMVWTAAEKSYAEFIVNNCLLKKSNRKLHNLLSRDDCDISLEHNNILKDLSLLEKQFNMKKYNMKNTFIIDDNPDVYQKQRFNCIKAKPYKYNALNDDFLLTLKTNLSKMHLK